MFHNGFVNYVNKIFTQFTALTPASTMPGIGQQMSGPDWCQHYRAIGAVLNEQSRMTQAEFEELRPRLSGFKVTSVSVYEAVVVRGLSQAEAAREFRMSRQNVNATILRITAVLDDCPPDWVPLNLNVPPSMAIEVKERVKLERERIAQEKAGQSL